jgi:hypothetical protein
MSTRATVTLLDASGSKLSFYRHYDGYPAAMGADLARKLKKMSKRNKHYQGWAAFANMLIEDTYEQQAHETKPKRVYEITDAEHGDLDYKYAVMFDKNNDVTVHVWESRWVNSERKWTKHAMFEIGFRHYVARECMDMRKRIKDWNAKNKAA